MKGKRALISGYGIAGAAIAYWLVRGGWDVTVVERAGAPRSSGNPVDIRGEAVTVVRAMGCYDVLRARATGVTHVMFVDEAGRRIARHAIEPSDPGGWFEIARHDLAEGLGDAVAGARIVYGDSILDVRQDLHGVDATFASGAQLRADVLVAADGLHSRVRDLMFAPEDAVVSRLGMWIATLPYPAAVDLRTVRVQNRPGRAASLHPAGGRPIAALMFRQRPPGGWDARDPNHQKRLVAGAFAGFDSLLPDITERVASTDDLYFDAVSRVRVPRWWTGRVVLLGDAASSVTIFGDGSSMAVVGAWELANALERHAEVSDAFAAYEGAHRRRVEARQRRAWLASHLLVPSSRLGLTGRNAFLRATERFGHARRRPDP